MACDSDSGDVIIKQAIAPHNGISGYKVEVSITQAGSSWAYSVTRDTMPDIPKWVPIPPGTPYWDSYSDMHNTIESIISSVEWELTDDEGHD